MARYFMAALVHDQSVGGCGDAKPGERERRDPRELQLACAHSRYTGPRIRLAASRIALRGLAANAPRYPIVLAGIVAPLLWTGLLWSTLNVIDPLLDARLDWGWFVVCQIAFGITAGIVVGRSEKIRTLQHLSFAVRSGVEGDLDPRRKSESATVGHACRGRVGLGSALCVRPDAGTAERGLVHSTLIKLQISPRYTARTARAVMVQTVLSGLRCRSTIQPTLRLLTMDRSPTPSLRGSPGLRCPHLP